MPVRLLARSHRVGLIAMSYFGIVYALVNSAGYPYVAGKTAAAQAAFGAQMQALAAQIVWLLPQPMQPGTLAGYVQWRAYGFLALVFPAWALLSAAGATRGDEEKGLVETWLSSGLSHTRYVVNRFSAFAAVSLFALTLTGVAAWLGAITASAPVAPVRIVESSLSLWALTLSCYGIALLIAQQLTSFRGAAGWGGIVLLALFLIDSLRRSTSPSPAFGSWSPFSLNDGTTAIAPGGSFDGAATVILFAVALATAAGAAVVFNRRDIYAGLVRLRRGLRVSRDMSHNPLLRLPLLRGLWAHRLALAAWTLGSAALAAFVVAIINSAADLFTKTSSLAGFLRGLGGDIHVVLLGLIWFAFAQALFSIIAITYVWRWADDDSNGSLELELAQPVSRTAVTVERAAELLCFLVVVALVSSAVVLLVASATHINVALGNLVVATALLLPFGLTFAAVGAVLAGFQPRVAVGVLATVSVVSYLLFQLAPAFRWPNWAADLSVFQLYGEPLVQPVFVGGLIAMLAVVVVGFGAGGALMQRRDVAG
ncbi:MAG: hypothetical protein JOZ92_06865 [Candidatus Dormibacteraeota bacterium]|nr:hypothetical protein [Candidatus Dormibacteraeota bacterium]